MKQVKFLNEADRPQIKAPYTFTQWCESKGYLHWASTIDDKAAEYAAYLASFPTEKKSVMLTEWFDPEKGYVTFEGSPSKPAPMLELWHMRCPKQGDLFIEIAPNGEKNFYKGHLNSSYY